MLFVFDVVLGVVYFRFDIEDFIVFEFVGFSLVFVFFNVDEVEIEGVEVIFFFFLVDSVWFEVSYIYFEVVDVEDDE